MFQNSTRKKKQKKKKEIAEGQTNKRAMISQKRVCANDGRVRVHHYCTLMQYEKKKKIWW